MSILDAASDAAAEAPVAKWVESALDGAQKLLDRDGNRHLMPIALPALLQLRSHATDLEKFGRWGAVTTLAAFGAGRTEPEILQWLRAGATFQERLAAQRAADDDLLAAAQARIEAWKGVREVLYEVGRTAVRAALPFILASIRELHDD